MSSSPVVGTREVAYRLFAAEFDDATLSYSESDEERAPNYVVSPTGARLNRTFVAGVLTEVEHVNDEVLRGRVADPTGAFVTYAGQYQPEPMAFLEQTTPPAFVALTGKARTYQPDDSEMVFTSVRPESINEVDADVRDKWAVSAAEATLHRIAVFDEALSMPYRGEKLQKALEARGVESSLASGIPLAIDHYGTTRAYLEAVRTLAVQALEQVAGDRDQVESLALEPGEGDDVALGSLPELDLAPADGQEVEAAVAAVSDTTEQAAEPTEDEPAVDATAESESTDEPVVGETDAEEEPADEPASEPEPATAQGEVQDDADTEPASTEEPEPVVESEPEADSEPATEPESDPEPITESEPEPEAEPEPEPATASAESGGLGDFSDDLGDSEPDAGGSLGDFEDTDTADEPLGDFADTGSDSASETADASTDTAESTDEDLDPNGMYELDADERAEVEAEFGTEFTTGTDVDPAGEADIDVPDVDELEAEESAEVEPEPEPEPEPTTESEPPTEPESADTDEDATPAEDIDLESVVIDAMESLDDGDGASRENVVAAVVDDYGADPDAVEGAIQDALLGGRCYEPQEDVLKAI
ncbi:rpa-associated protein [Haloferax namakaokahaiae]|uniref:Rpa-associated protein n=1 Tax=Haloferax namakaokahaiae TaxID=1748331 RepID=A0ABD5ZEY1_9EURY